jgi:hypothetical protein
MVTNEGVTQQYKQLSACQGCNSSQYVEKLLSKYTHVLLSVSLQWCNSSVTVVLRWCYEGGQGCYRGVMVANKLKNSSQNTLTWVSKVPWASMDSRNSRESSINKPDKNLLKKGERIRHLSNKSSAEQMIQMLFSLRSALLVLHWPLVGKFWQA